MGVRIIFAALAVEKAPANRTFQAFFIAISALYQYRVGNTGRASRFFIAVSFRIVSCPPHTDTFIIYPGTIQSRHFPLPDASEMINKAVKILEIEIIMDKIIIRHSLPTICPKTTALGEDQELSCPRL